MTIPKPVECRFCGTKRTLINISRHERQCVRRCRPCQTCGELLGAMPNRFVDAHKLSERHINAELALAAREKGLEPL